MDHLPDLAIFEIISNFRLNDQFKLRSINKRWKSLIEFSAKNKKCIFVYDKLYSNQERWPSEDKLVSDKEIINQIFFENFCLKNNYFPNMVKLFLYKIRPARFKKNELISELLKLVKNLKELSINNLTHMDEYDGYYGDELLYEIIDIENLILPHLKVFSIKNFYIPYKSIKINAPILEKFIAYFKMNLFQEKIVLSNPESIKLLECQNFDFYDQCFPNLEILICQNVSSNFSLSNYSKLKRFEFYPTYRNPTLFQNPFRQRLESNLNNIEIIIYGLKFERMDENFEKMKTYGIIYTETANELFDIYKFSTYLNKMKYDKIFIVNYFKLNFLLNYKESMHIENFYLSKINIEKLIVENLKDLKNLTEFLKKIKGIKYLDLYYCFLNEENIEYLKSVPFISSLTILDCEFSANFNFIGEIKYLNYLEFRQTNHSIDQVNDFISSIEKFNIEKYRFVNSKLCFNNEKEKIRFGIQKQTDHRNFENDVYYFEKLDEVRNFISSSNFF